MLNSIQEVDQEMEGVLNQDSLPADVLMKEYDTLLNRYLSLQNQTNMAPVAANTLPSSTTKTAPEPTPTVSSPQAASTPLQQAAPTTPLSTSAELKTPGSFTSSKTKSLPKAVWFEWEKSNPEKDVGPLMKKMLKKQHKVPKLAPAFDTPPSTGSERLLLKSVVEPMGKGAQLRRSKRLEKTKINLSPKFANA